MNTNAVTELNLNDMEGIAGGYVNPDHLMKRGCDGLAAGVGVGVAGGFVFPVVGPLIGGVAGATVGFISGVGIGIYEELKKK